MPSDEALLTVQLLRFLREHGHKPKLIECCYRKVCWPALPSTLALSPLVHLSLPVSQALEWRLKNLPLDLLEEQYRAVGSRWLATVEMPHGDWATQHAFIGMHCGFSKGGHPVKIERIGAFDLAGLQRGRNSRQRLNHFYLALVDCLQRRLDQTTLETGKLQQTYEIFDMSGMGWQMLTLTTVNFTRDVLGAFATHYPSSFSKVQGARERCMFSQTLRSLINHPHQSPLHTPDPLNLLHSPRHPNPPTPF